MIEILLIMLVVLASIATYRIQRAHDEKICREKLRDERLRELANESKAIRAVELIGFDAYKEMSARIKKIKTLHKDQKNILLSLTCGPDTEEGEKEVNSVLPGSPVHFIYSVSRGNGLLDVYSNGVRIGRLALEEAENVKRLMRTNRLTAAYVAEQNCYGMSGRYDLNIVIYYESHRESLLKYPKKKISELREQYKVFEMDNFRNYKVTDIDFCQN